MARSTRISSLIGPAWASARPPSSTPPSAARAHATHAAPDPPPTDASASQDLMSGLAYPRFSRSTARGAGFPEEWQSVIQERARRKTLADIFEPLGSTQTRENSWQAHHSLNRPVSPAELTMSALMASGAHLGHTRQRTRPTYLPYIYGRRAGLNIIDLDQTLPLFRRAASFIRAVMQREGSILFIGTHVDGVQTAARRAARRVGRNAYHVSEKWLPGTLTNASTLLGVDKIEGDYLPDVAVFLNPQKNMHAIRECNVALIPTVGIIDSNADPRIVTYAIPANDESLRTVELIAGVLSVAAREGLLLRMREIEENRVKAAEAAKRRNNTKLIE